MALTYEKLKEIMEDGGFIENNYLYSAALKDMDVSYSMQNTRTAIASGNALKIAFVGDSITEGFNVVLRDSWVERFIGQIRKKLPGVTVTYTNFALGGRNIANFIDPSYVATSPETDPATNFWRSWSTVGKSWRDHVRDYQADMTVIAFGMNDTIYGQSSGANFAANLAAAITHIKSTRANMDIALVSCILPTDNKTLYNQSEMETQNLARISREYAVNNSHALIDANRLWKISRYGVDDCRFYTKDLNSMAEINAETAYGFDATFVFSSFPAFADECDFDFGIYGAKKHVMRFYNLSGSNYAELYTDGGVSAKIWTLTSSTVIIKVEGSIITVDGVDLVYYDRLYDGAMDATKITSYVSSVYLGARKQLECLPIYNEAEMLGLVTDPFGTGYEGNGINHPTSAGHYLTYYTASHPVINSLVNPIRKGQAFSLTPENGWADYGSGYRTISCYISDDGFVKVHGLVSGGTVTPNTTIATLPAGFRPPSNMIFACASAGAYADITIYSSDGTIRTGTGVSATWLSLENVYFRT